MIRSASVILLLPLLAGCDRPETTPPISAPQTSPLNGLFVLQDTKTARVSSWDRTGGNNDFVAIGPGETKALADISGAGIIRRFFVSMIASDRMRLRKLVLRMYWDGEKSPCVEVPLGDFFGSGLGTLRRFHSIAVDVNPGFSLLDFDGMVSYLPMPFAKGARITVENDGGVADVTFYYHIDYETLPASAVPPASVGHLHAQWRRDPHTAVAAGKPKNSQFGNMTIANTTGDANFVVLEAAGHGNFVGLFLTVDNIAGSWYGEGDDMIFIDGAKWPPTYPGSGHEEIFGAGAVPDEEFSGEYTGFYLIENLKGAWGGKNQMYRFYINDPIRFRKSIRFTIEHGHDNNFENDYTSTAFWYQDEPHKAFPALPPAAQRLPAWPAGVAQAIELETHTRLQVATPVSPGVVPLSAHDFTAWNALEGARDKDFRALRYDDFVRDVNASEAILKPYPQYKRQ